MGGICIRCGALKDEAEEQGVALSYIHRGLEVSKHEAERVRQVGGRWPGCGCVRRRVAWPAVEACSASSVAGSMRIHALLLN